MSFKPLITHHSLVTAKRGVAGSLITARLAQRRGTVLIMVVALLGMLFVAGVAFLQSVTFEARQINSELISRDKLAAVDAVEAKVFQALNRTWLAEDGRPYRMSNSARPGDLVDTNRKLILPVYGEVPYLHGTLAPLEPFLYEPSTGPQPVIPFSTDLRSVLSPAPVPVAPTDQFDQAWLFLAGLPGDAADADGDGVPESRMRNITSNGPNGLTLLPPRLRDALAGELNVPGSSGDNVFAAFRLVPHGGMVDINHAHPLLVSSLLNGGTPFTPGGPYPPELEEAALRHRGGLPARQIGESALHRYTDGALQDPDGFEGLLLGALGPDSATRGKIAAHRWWRHDLSEWNPSATPTPPWFDMSAAPAYALPPEDLSPYDRRHVVSVDSTDDLFLRDGTLANGRGWIEAINTNGTEWALDDYPGMELIPDDDGNPLTPRTDPRVGRMQISLPYLEKQLLAGSIDALPTSTNAVQVQFIRTLQDGFLLMLRNVDPTVKAMNQAERERTAAALTANLIDFADTDDNPTQVQIRDIYTGVGTGLFVYGLERQPFITEIYTKVVGGDPDSDSVGDPDLAQSFSAIELYNPYEVILKLDAFKFRVRYDSGPPVVEEEYSLAGEQILPGKWQVFLLADSSFSGGPPGAVKLPFTLSPAEPYLKLNAEVSLLRLNPAGGGDLIVEHFLVDSARVAANFYDGTIGTLASDVEEGSLERAMWRPDLTGQPDIFWTVPVPRVTGQTGETLGRKNNWQGDETFGPQKERIRPVQVDFADNGNLWRAYPTTGCLLLLMRSANQEFAGGAGKPFNAELVNANSNGPNDPPYQIDNGHMPVFDMAGRHRASRGGPERGLPMGCAFLPWGQYVFDYFTALPLEHPGGPPPGMVIDLPAVDQVGARVHGRININAAPWPVLAGLPVAYHLTPGPVGGWGGSAAPNSFQQAIKAFYGSTYNYCFNGGFLPDAEVPLGERLAKAIVAYRDARSVTAATGDYALRQPDVNDLTIGNLREGSGFLTVGELANIRHPGLTWEQDPDAAKPGDAFTCWRLDSGVIGRSDDSTGYPAEDYVQAVGLLMALGDWVTTRSNVWTIYGTLRGDQAAAVPVIVADLVAKGTPLAQAQAMAPVQAKAELDARAIRFEETVDRLPSALKPGTPPRRIGPRTVGAYNDTRAQ